MADSDSDLIAIGYWQSAEDAAFPRPHQLVRAPLSPARREQLCSYLAAGAEFMAWLGYSHCRFDCGVPYKAMGARDLTDGVWVWPEGLVHYVEMHDVALPASFVRHATRPGWQTQQVVVPPLRPLPDGSSRIPVTYDFWKDYVESHREGDVEREETT